MNRDLSDYRKSYDKEELIESNISKSPMVLFEKWFSEMESHYPDNENNAMTISTFGLDGFPKGRVMLLKKFSQEGFTFYTNYESEKGKAINSNPNVCLSFFWHQSERQVLIKGKAERIPEHLSEAYFKSRPRGSQLGALVSHQSEVIENRTVLENQLSKLENLYEGKEIPKPENWGGYLVKPVEMEFWQGRANRLHDRIRYSLIASDNWKIDRLSP